MQDIIAQGIGIDSGKNSLDIFILPANKYYKCANNEKGFAQILKILRQFNNINSICFEATNIYHRAIERFLAQHNFPIHRIHPVRSKYFVRYKGINAKTDKSDAQSLAMMALEITGEPTIAPDDTIVVLRALFRKYENVRDQIALAKSCDYDPVCQKIIGKFDNSILKSNNKIAQDIVKTMLELVLNHAKYARIYQILTSIKGVGNIIALAIITYLPEIGSISNRQISSLVGVAPKPNESGDFIGKAHIAGGRKLVRNMLYLLSLNVLRFHQSMRALFIKMKQKNKHGKEIIVIIMHKLLKMMNSMVASDRLWSENTISHKPA